MRALSGLVVLALLGPAAFVAEPQIAAVCAPVCDGADPAGGVGDHRPVPDAFLNGRRIGVHIDNGGMAWATVENGRTGDEVWL